MFLVYLVIGALQMFSDDDDDGFWNNKTYLHILQPDVLLTYVIVNRTHHVSITSLDRKSNKIWLVPNHL